VGDGHANLEAHVVPTASTPTRNCLEYLANTVKAANAFDSRKVEQSGHVQISVDLLDVRD
jgi:hypothetical protein